MISQVRLGRKMKFWFVHDVGCSTTLPIYLASINDIAEMRKQRKMGHITIVGPSMSIVEARLKLMLSEELLDGNTAGQLSR